eukprot:746504-Hanusia_phi.AAC.12
MQLKSLSHDGCEQHRVLESPSSEQAHGNVGTGYGSRATMGGIWLLFRRVVESRDGEAMNKMCCLPPRIDNVSDKDQQERHFRSWFHTRWPFLLLWGGGIEYVLESDDEAGRSNPPLFAVVYKALIKLYNKARSHKIPGFASGSFLQPLLKIMVRVPMFASDLRVKLTLTTIKQLESFEKTAFLFSRDDIMVNQTNDFLQHNGIHGASVLALACRTCRLDIVNAVLKAGDHLMDLPDSNLLGFYPLHHASLPMFSSVSTSLSLQCGSSQPTSPCTLCTAALTGGRIRREATRSNFMCGGLSWSVVYWVAGEAGSAEFTSAHLFVFLADIHQLHNLCASRSRCVIHARLTAANHQGISFADESLHFGIENSYHYLSMKGNFSPEMLSSALEVSFSLLMKVEGSEANIFEQQLHARRSDKHHIVKLLLEKGSKETNFSKPMTKTTLNIAGLGFLMKIFHRYEIVVTHSDLLRFDTEDDQQDLPSKRAFVDIDRSELAQRNENLCRDEANSDSDVKQEKEPLVEIQSKGRNLQESKAGTSESKTKTLIHREKIASIMQMIRSLDWLMSACKSSVPSEVTGEDSTQSNAFDAAGRSEAICARDSEVNKQEGWLQDEQQNGGDDEDKDEDKEGEGNQTRDADNKNDSRSTALPVDLDVAQEFKESVYWELRFTREFKEVLVSLKSQPVLLRSLLHNLNRLAAGEQGRSIMKQLKGSPKGMQIMESPCKTFNDGPRFLWQYAVDYSPKIKNFVETIRLWRICLQHDDVSKGMEHIINSYKRGRTSTVRKHLRPAHTQSCMVGKRRLPRQYVPCDSGVQVEELLREDLEKFETLEEEGEASRVGQVVYTPPAVSLPGSYNIVKFYELSEDVRRSILASLDLTGKEEAARNRSLSDEPELPFILDEHEDELISAVSRAESVLLVGRSGTGKTSIAIGRMWSMQEHWRMTFEGSSLKYHQVFLTASKVLRDQVRRSYEALSSASRPNPLLPPPPAGSSLKNVSEGQWPLFLTQAEWLRMVDATLDTPFFPRAADGSMQV